MCMSEKDKEMILAAVDKVVDIVLDEFYKEMKLLRQNMRADRILIEQLMRERSEASDV